MANGLRLSGIRADHVLASSGWRGANGHSKRVLDGAQGIGLNDPALSFLPYPVCQQVSQA
jgi:hypothetical protein